MILSKGKLAIVKLYEQTTTTTIHLKNLSDINNVKEDRHYGIPDRLHGSRTSSIERQKIEQDNHNRIINDDNITLTYTLNLAVIESIHPTSTHIFQWSLTSNITLHKNIYTVYLHMNRKDSFCKAN